MQLTLSRCLKILLVLLRLPASLAFFLVMNTLRIIAPEFTLNMFKKKLSTTGKWGFAEKINSVDDMDFLFSFVAVKKTFLLGIKNALKEALEGEPAPNPSVYDLATKKTMSLLSTSTKGRPLVLNFGSCS